MDCSTSGLPVHHQLPEFTQTHVHWVSDTIQPSHPLSSPSPAFNLSQQQGLFKRVSSLHQVAKVLEFQHSISPSNGYSELISFRMDWLDRLAIQGTLKSLLQHDSSKASVLSHDFRCTDLKVEICFQIMKTSVSVFFVVVVVVIPEIYVFFSNSGKGTYG